MDIVVEAGVGGGSLDTGMRVLDDGGTMVAIALHREEAGPLLASDFYNKQVTIVGTRSAPYDDPALRRKRFTMASNIEYLYDLAARGRLALEALHADTYTAWEAA